MSFPRSEEKESGQSSVRNESVIYLLRNTHLEHYPFPCVEMKPDPRNQLTIGDLHGNALKFIHFLVFQNVLVLSREDYQKIVTIYNLPPDEITKKIIDKFSDILKRSTINPVGLIRLIGDELADRGNNDIWTLKILEVLVDKKVPIEILFSNHTAEFLNYSIPGADLSCATDVLDEQFRSLQNLARLILQRKITSDAIQALADKYHTPLLKLLSYSVDDVAKPPILTLYAHAAVGLETVKALADFYQIKYDDANLVTLCRTIDNINEHFCKTINGSITHYWRQFAAAKAACKKKYFGTETVSLKHPLCRIAWTRSDNDKDLDLPVLKNGYQLRLVHGHDGPRFDETGLDPTVSYQENIINLDNSHGKEGGKWRTTDRGNFYSLCTQDKNKPSELHEESKPEAQKSLRYKIVKCSVYKHPEALKILDKTADQLTVYSKNRRNEFSFFRLLLGDPQANAAEQISAWCKGRDVPELSEAQLAELADPKSDLGEIIAEAKECEILPSEIINFKLRV
ncbi:MAG: hypothetical protein ACYCQI_15810 [Gammaproteobacteria bacterium]